MKIGIVGAGAMGSVYAAMLGGAGNDLWLVDVWRDHVDAINRDGLTVDGPKGRSNLKCHATTDPKEVGTCDLVILATKSLELESGARSALPLIGPGTGVLTIQNGLGGAERIAPIVGAERLMVGIAGGFGAALVGPGHALHNGASFLHLGPLRPPAATVVAAAADAWRATGIEVRVFEDTRPMVWGKLMANIAFPALCTITGMRIGQVIDNPETSDLATRCTLEAAAVCKAKSITLPYDDPVAFVYAFGRKIPAAIPSMTQDVLAGRRSEIDFLNGAVAREGAALGVPVPVNEMLARLVRALEGKTAAVKQTYGIV